jgi:type IV pilus assembly protein PilA
MSDTFEEPSASGEWEDGSVKRIQNQKGFTLIELMVVVSVLGIVSAIAVPNYLRYQGKSRQSEARVNLGGIFVSELTFFGENSRFSNFTEIGFAPAARTNRYAYRSHGTNAAGADTGVQVITPGVGNDEGENLVVASASSIAGFTATATANLDQDAMIDMWHINDLKQNVQTPDMNDS